MRSSPSGTARPSFLERSLLRLWFPAWSLVERALYRNREYTVLVPYGNRVLTPWFDNSAGSTSFGEAFRAAGAGGPMAVTPDRCHVIHQFVRWAATAPGDMAEAGVFTGGTAHLIAETLRQVDARPTLHLFDSFEGMPASADPDRDYHASGDFGETSLRMVQARLAGYDFARFHVGYVPATFDEVEPDVHFSFVHVDMDIYPSMLDCCRWFWPRINPGGVMVFDDYGFFHLRRAARTAVDEFFADQPEEPIVLPTGQALVIKRSAPQ